MHRGGSGGRIHAPQGLWRSHTCTVGALEVAYMHRGPFPAVGVVVEGYCLKILLPLGGAVTSRTLCELLI